MKKYIVDLTNDLIQRNRFDAAFPVYVAKGWPEDVRGHIRRDIEVGEVFNMNPETLGKIMLQLEPTDLRQQANEIMKKVKFHDSDPGYIFRELVAVCLADVIVSRLDGEIPEIPRYKRGE